MFNIVIILKAISVFASAVMLGLAIYEILPDGMGSKKRGVIALRFALSLTLALWVVF